MRREPLDERELRDGLAGSSWARVDVVDETGSTNADLLARAAAGDDIDGAVLFAEHQRSGRGRCGRSWTTAPRAQLALSAGISALGVPTERWGWLPLAAGVAVIDAVAAATGVRARLKWPNDVMAGPGKLAGILAEVAAPSPVIVVGIGLNVTLSATEAAEPGLASLAALGVAAPDRTALARDILRELGGRVEQWRTGRAEEMAADYRARSATIGSTVRALLPGDHTIVGHARDVDAQGRLCIDADGETVAVSAGDVVHLRTTS